MLQTEYNTITSSIKVNSSASGEAEALVEPTPHVASLFGLVWEVAQYTMGVRKLTIAKERELQADREHQLAVAKAAPPAVSPQLAASAPAAVRKVSAETVIDQGDRKTEY
eukprot:5695129-Pyramimonas_sp.AAC.1